MCLAHGLSCSMHDMWDLPESGFKLTFPALAGGATREAPKSYFTNF